MNRRGFLGTLLGLLAAPFVASKAARGWSVLERRGDVIMPAAAWAKTDFGERGYLAWRAYWKPATLNDDWIAVERPDPSTAQDLSNIGNSASCLQSDVVLHLPLEGL